MDDETQAGELYLDSLAVLPDYRRQGIAQCLLHATKEKADKMGLPFGVKVKMSVPFFRDTDVTNLTILSPKFLIPSCLSCSGVYPPSTLYQDRLPSNPRKPS